MFKGNYWVIGLALTISIIINLLTFPLRTQFIRTSDVSSRDFSSFVEIGTHEEFLMTTKDKVGINK